MGQDPPKDEVAFFVKFLPKERKSFLLGFGEGKDGGNAGLLLSVTDERPVGLLSLEKGQGVHDKALSRARLAQKGDIRGIQVQGGILDDGKVLNGQF